MSRHCGRPSKRTYQQCVYWNKKLGNPCRDTTQTGTPFVDVDTALVNAGLSQVRS